MDKNSKNRNLKNIRHQNVLESLKGIGGGTVKSLSKDVIKSQDFMNQILGNTRSYSGEISAGESIEMNDVFSGKREENEKFQKQMALEHKLLDEEKQMIEKKSNELKIQLQAVMKEVQLLTQTTQNLSKEVQIATLQAPVEPGIYHVIFFEKLLEFLKSFRKKVEDASVWLHATNSRAQKKNYWSSYQKNGGKFLLSADHYLTRSAG